MPKPQFTDRDETKQLQKEWDNKQDKIEEDFDKFVLYFDKHRTCTCKSVDDCRHFDRALKIFDKQLDELGELYLKIFGRVYQETIKPALENHYDKVI